MTDWRVPFNRPWLTGDELKYLAGALESGHLTPETVLNDPGVLKVGTQEFKNAGDAVNGPLALRQALTPAPQPSACR